MRRVTELDSLRGLAAVSIIIYHMWHPALFLGWPRVDLFFVLSGYVVSAMILAKGSTAGFYRTFFVRRVLRLWPLYYLTLAAVVAINPWLDTPQPMAGLPQYLTFTQNVECWLGRGPTPFSEHLFHTWSLALEARFYLFWPAVVMLAGPRRLVPISAALMLGSAAARAAGASSFVLAGRCDGFAAGAILAGLLADPEAVRRRFGRLRAGFAAALGAGLATVAAGVAIEGVDPVLEAVPWPGLSILAVNTTYLGLIGLVALNAGHRRLAPLRDPRLLTLGSWSYAIYLLHLPVLRALALVARRAGLETGLGFDLFRLAACLAAAGLAYRLVERPIYGLRERFAYGPPRPGGGPKARPRRAWAAAR